MPVPTLTVSTPKTSARRIWLRQTDVWREVTNPKTRPRRHKQRAHIAYLESSVRSILAMAAVGALTINVANAQPFPFSFTPPYPPRVGPPSSISGPNWQAARDAQRRAEQRKLPPPAATESSASGHDARQKRSIPEMYRPPPPSPKSTLAPPNEQSHGNYRSPAKEGNGCGGFGVVAIDEVETLAAGMMAEISNGSVGGGRAHPLAGFRDRFNKRMNDLHGKYGELYSPYDMRDLYIDMEGLASGAVGQEKTIRECLPFFS